jgi:hypothetical protein
MAQRSNRKFAAATISSSALDADQDGAPPPFQQFSFSGHGFDNGTDLTISVDNPYVVGETMLNTHTIYHLSYKTSRPDLSNPSADLVRRFSDFAWLHDCLTERYPGRFVPALPDKFPVQAVLQKVQQNSPFLSERCRALHRFMNRLARHPFLSRSKEFVSFLQIPHTEISRERQQQEERKVSAAGGGFLGTAWSFMGSAFTGVKQAGQRVILGSKLSIPNDPKITALSEYVSNLEVVVGDLRRLLEELHHRRTEFGTAFSDLGTCLTAFSNVEELGGHLRDPLHESATASIKAGHLLLSKKDDIPDVADLPQEMLRQARQHHFDFGLMLASIDDFIRVIVGARDCFRRRYDIAQNERDLSEELARKKQHSSMTDVGELEMKIEEERQRLNGMAAVIDEEVCAILFGRCRFCICACVFTCGFLCLPLLLCVFVCVCVCVFCMFGSRHSQMAWFSNVKQIEIDWVLRKLVDW